jgi:hypothetical protein
MPLFKIEISSYIFFSSSFVKVLREWCLFLFTPAKIQQLSCVLCVSNVCAHYYSHSHGLWLVEPFFIYAWPNHIVIPICNAFITINTHLIHDNNHGAMYIGYMSFIQWVICLFSCCQLSLLIYWSAFVYDSYKLCLMPIVYWTCNSYYSYL